MKTIKIRKWFIFTEWGVTAIPYVFDLSKEDVSNDEISLCVQEQIYGDKIKKSKKGLGRSYGY